MIAPLGGLLGTILGDVLWAKYIQWPGHTAGFIAISIGVFTREGMLMTGSRSLPQDAPLMASFGLQASPKMTWRTVRYCYCFCNTQYFYREGKYLDV